MGPLFRSTFLVNAKRVMLVLVGLGVLRGGASAQQRRVTLPERRDTVAGRAVFGTIDGIVSDTGLAPIQAAEFIILRTTLKVGTGPNGRFRIVKVLPGQYLVIVRRVGYRPTSAVIDVQPNDTLRLAYTLEPFNATALDPVIITERRMSTRLAEFENRRKLGIGEFMGSEEIAKRNSVYATDLFRRFPSINVGPSATSAIPVYYALSKREGGSISLSACPFTVYVDRVPMPTPFNLELLPSPKELAGIEVYNGASTIPPQYSGFNRGCGVILVWTRDGY